MVVTTNYSFNKQNFGHPVRDEDIGDNLVLIDTAIKAREDEIATLKTEIHSVGASTFAGPTGLTITHNLNISDYDVSIKPSADAAGALGEVWVTDVAVNSFVVRNSGAAVTGFTWIVHRQT